MAKTKIRKLSQPNRSQLASVYIGLGVAAVLASIPSLRTTWIVFVASIIGGGLLVYVAKALNTKQSWARDILLVFTGLMTLLALFTLVSAFQLTWVIIGLICLYLLWGLIDL